MYNVTIYEDGEPFSFYEDNSKQAISLVLKDEKELLNLIDITLQNGHSIEIFNKGENYGRLDKDIQENTRKLDLERKKKI